MHNQSTGTSTLSLLRALSSDETRHDIGALRDLAERQALLLRHLNAGSGASLEDVVGRMPHVHVQAGDIPTSGLSHWDGHQWIITYNANEPKTRQRFTILHEYKHIIDHPMAHDLYRDATGVTANEQMEQAADYFAGCALVPRPLLLVAWLDGLRDPERLARHFDVSVPAINVRLTQVGLPWHSGYWPRRRKSHNQRTTSTRRMTA